MTSWMKEGEGISQRTLCITHGHRRGCGDKQREGEGQGGGRQRGGMGAAVVVLTIKKIVKNTIK